ncbi:MAG TPA: plastocyanin/azurin family copper-binding protein [Solirubrobacterales bacterium]|nr:plastocyanin/azurin family copper-binding protein [Solirubrobacterales bacterium]
MRKRFLTLTAVVVVVGAALALAACGGSDDTGTSAATTATSAETTTGGSGGGGETVSFEADPGGQLAYTQTDVTAKPGNATIEFDNPASIGHDVVIEDESGKEIAKTDIITGSTTSTTADLKAGTYTFFCSVPGHREAGMEGTLTVK